MNEDDLNALAGEYVLGLLEGLALDEAQALRATDAGFNAAIAMWERQLLPLLEQVAPIAAPPEVWARIEARTRKRAARAGWLGKFRWRIGFAATGLAVAALAGIMIVPPLLQNQGRQIATLTSTTGGVFIVRERANSLRIIPENVSLPMGKVAELWRILPNRAPQPAGLFTPGQALATSLPGSGVGLELAVSLEPAGGSPTGLPTGPILAEAKITNY